MRHAQVPGMRKWLKFERSGRTEILQVDKHAIALQTGVQVRQRCRSFATLRSIAVPMQCHVHSCIGRQPSGSSSDVSVEVLCKRPKGLCCLANSPLMMHPGASSSETCLHAGLDPAVTACQYLR